MASSVDRKDDGVYGLLTELCAKTASQYGENSRISQKHLMGKMRSHSYGIILGKNCEKIPVAEGEPVSDLWSYYFISQHNVKNIAEHKRAVELKEVISKIRNTVFGDEQEKAMKVLKCLLILKNSVKPDLSQEIYKNPFTFGRLDEMLPKLSREPFGSPDPYHYYPSYVFELPFALKSQGNLPEKQKSAEYTVENYSSSSCILGVSNFVGGVKKRFASPMSIPSITSADSLQYSTCNVFDFPRLNGQRDLQIPGSSSNYPTCKITLPDSQEKVVEVFKPKITCSDNIWEVASRVDKDIPEDIWEVVSKMPPVQQRRLIATSTREVGLWRRKYSSRLCDLEIVPERQLIRHIMYLIIGVETSSFPFNQYFNCFYIKEDLALEGISIPHLKGYVRDLLLIGTYYKRLYQFAFNHSVEDHFRSKGLVYEAAREVVRQYLLSFRLAATDIYEECTSDMQNAKCLPTLLQILYHMEPLKYEIETVASIYKMINHDFQHDVEVDITLKLVCRLGFLLFFSSLIRFC